MKPLIVGELNPFDGDPRYALFPYALSSSGSRLCAILGLCERDHLRRFDRANLCTGTWDAEPARAMARRILRQRRRVLILLGEKVATAFFGEFEAFSVGHLLGTSIVMLPHPSGLNRMWNAVNAASKARRALRIVGAL